MAPWSAPSHLLLGNWCPRADRADPIALLQTQEAQRISWLVPVRHARMAQNPFAYYRGAPVVMAADLGTAPSSGLEVQLCGDAHLFNFGFYASPERALLFDINDFDETARGPFEWDVKRLVASLVIAARSLGLPPSWQERIARRAARAYRKAIRRLADTPWLEVWSHRFDMTAYVREIRHEPFRRYLEQVTERARHRDSRQAVRKLCEPAPDGSLRIRHDPPLIWRHAEIPPDWLENEQPLEERVASTYATYLASLRPETRRLLDCFRIADTANKAVGVGSIGTRCSIGLFLGPREDDILVLQSKQAEPSVLAPYATSPAPDHQGQRVVEGQRLMQTVSDLYLGWTTNAHGEQLYWRHFRDWKGSVELEALDAEGLRTYGKLCAAVLAKAHARSGDRVAIATYLGESRSFDAAMTAFATAYADQSDADYRQLLQAISTGRLSTSTVF